MIYTLSTKRGIQSIDGWTERQKDRQSVSNASFASLKILLPFINVMNCQPISQFCMLLYISLILVLIDSIILLVTEVLKIIEFVTTQNKSVLQMFHVILYNAQ